MPNRRSEQRKESKVFDSATDVELAIGKLQRRIKDLKDIESNQQIDGDALEQVRLQMIANLRDIFGPNSPEFDRYEHWHIWEGGFYVKRNDEPPHVQAMKVDRSRRGGIRSTVSELEGLIKQLQEKKEDLVSTTTIANEEMHAEQVFIHHPIDLLKIICQNFHVFATEIQHRQRKRPPILIQDEWDVQDFLRAILRSQFDDVRAEEWTPSYLERATRMDFLLPELKLSIEAKMTNQQLGAKEIGDQLIIDIAHYERHPDVKKLLCFIYDPSQVLRNRAGFIKDLQSKTTTRLEVIAVICG